MKQLITALFWLIAILASLEPQAYANNLSRTLPMWPTRPYLVHVPSPVPTGALPIFLAIHGGGGNASAMLRSTCASGDPSDSTCLNALSDQEGFVVVYPNGTANPDWCKQDPKYCEVRTFNAGGGKFGYNCASGYACDTDIDELAYFNNLLSDVATIVNVDQSRIYASGISNGGAMSHRLACQMSNRIAAIASVAAANQFSTSDDCSPVRAVPVMEIHGLSDAVWPYYGGPSNQSTVVGDMFSEKTSVQDWVIRNHCDPGAGIVNWLPNVDPINGTRAGIAINSSCADNSEVIHYFIQGGGHAWPGGWQILPPSTMGYVSYAISGNQIIWDFFKSHHL